MIASLFWPLLQTSTRSPTRAQRRQSVLFTVRSSANSADIFISRRQQFPGINRMKTSARSAPRGEIPRTHFIGKPKIPRKSPATCSPFPRCRGIVPNRHNHLQRTASNELDLPRAEPDRRLCEICQQRDAKQFIHLRSACHGLVSLQCPHRKSIRASMQARSSCHRAIR